MELGDVHWWAVVVAAAASFLLGGLWYGPLFGTAWQRVAGVGEDGVDEGGSGRVFGVAFLLQLLSAAVLALFLGPDVSLGFAIAAAGSAGLFWVAGSLGVIYLFERRPLAHWLINGGYVTIAFLSMGAILGAW